MSAAECAAAGCVVAGCVVAGPMSYIVHIVARSSVIFASPAGLLDHVRKQSKYCLWCAHLGLYKSSGHTN